MLPCCADALCSCDLLDNIKNRPHEVFLNDLMFFLSQECKVQWLPPCYTSYAIHPMSPLKPDICNYIRHNFRDTYARYELIWFLNCPKVEIDSEMFDSFTRELQRRHNYVFSLLISSDVFLLFSEIIKTAVNCIVFYERGMHDALSFGLTGLTEVFDEYLTKSGQRFEPILDHLLDLIQNLNTDNSAPDNITNIHEVFARDLLFYLCGLSRIEWIPPNFETYKIEAQSPLTSYVRQFIIKTRLDPSFTYYKLRAVFRKDESVFQSCTHALKTISEEISSAIIPQVRTTEQILILCIRTAAFSVEVHKRGMDVEILSRTLEHLSEALRKCNQINNGRIFNLFEAFSHLDLKTKGGISAPLQHLSTRYFIP